MQNASSDDIALTKAVFGLVAAAEALGRAGDQPASTRKVGPRRGLSRVEAASYVGVSPTTFDNLVKSKNMPKPVSIGARKIWDVRALDSAFDALSAPNEENPWDTWS